MEDRGTLERPAVKQVRGIMSSTTRVRRHEPPAPAKRRRRRRERILQTRRVLVALAIVALSCAIGAAGASAFIVRLSNGRTAGELRVPGRPLPAKALRPRELGPFDALFHNLDYSGGPVMPSSTNYTIVWKPSNYKGAEMATGTGGGVSQFFKDLATDSGKGTNPDAVSVQYNDTEGHTAAYSTHFGSEIVATDPLPASACPFAPAVTGGVCLDDEQVQAELAKVISKDGLPRDLTHEYFLVSPPAVAYCFDPGGEAGCSANASGNQAFCGYHSASAALPHFLYADIPDAEEGCGTLTEYCTLFELFCKAGPSGNPAADLLSVISHEHNESITDPIPNESWTDWTVNEVGEIGDKCAYKQYEEEGSIALEEVGILEYEGWTTTVAGSHYFLQPEWSNIGHRCRYGLSSSGTPVNASFRLTSAAGTTAQFDASASSGASEYVWQFEGGNTVGSSSEPPYTVETASPTISHTYSHPGTYQVALTVMASDGTSKGAAQKVEVPNREQREREEREQREREAREREAREREAEAVTGGGPAAGGSGAAGGSTGGAAGGAGPGGAAASARCIVPSLKGKTLASARKLLAGALCATGRLKKPKHAPRRPAGAHRRWTLVVAGQSAAAGSTAGPAGTPVNLLLIYKAVR